MSILSDWVTQIIIFIFIGSILELIIPNNSMKQYVHIVVGLILLLILIKPILFLFSAHVPSSIEEIERAIFNQEENLFTSEKQIELKESEIHQQQDAYIWNEVRSQLMYEANKELQDEAIGVYVSDIHFQTDDEAELELENIEKIIVTLSSDKQDETDIAIVQPIEIGKDQPQQETSESPIGNEVKEILTDLWGIEEEKMEYIWEEGAT